MNFATYDPTYPQPWDDVNVIVRLTQEEIAELRRRGVINIPGRVSDHTRNKTSVINKLVQALPPEPIKVGDVVRYTTGSPLNTYTVLGIDGRTAWLRKTDTRATYADCSMNRLVRAS